MRLTDADYAALERSYITRSLAQAAGLYRVDSLEGRELVGKRGSGNWGGIAYPNHRPGESAVIGVHLRLDCPPIDALTGKELGKYQAPPGQRNHFYCLLAEPRALSDPSVTAVFAEGQKKYLALVHAAIEAAALNGAASGTQLFCAIGLFGVDGWHGKIGSTTDAEGRRVDVKGAVPDFDRFEWRGRKVILCFDANTHTNQNVRWARSRLARELESRGAIVYLIDLPEGPGINGPDDFLYVNGLDAFLALYRGCGRYDWHDELVKSEKGKILPTFSNALTALRLAPAWRDVLGYNEFALRVELRASAPWGGATGPWGDLEDSLLIEWMEHQGIRISDAHATRAAVTIAREHPYHPVRDYLDSLKWDGKHRLDNWLTTYLGVEEDDYTRAVGPRWLISAVARAYRPGCKADHALILEGLQGIGKSSAFEILGGEFYSDDIAELGTKDAALGTAGTWIVELAELSAMGRAEVERIKSFISRLVDRFRPPYGRHYVWTPRQCVFGGSVNLLRYLKDETGGRRFWPVHCGRLDLESLRRDRDQLIAEAKVRFEDGDPWWLDTPKLVELAGEEQEERYQADPWEDIIAGWLLTQAEVTTADALAGPLNKDIGQWTRADEIRVGVIYNRLGWEVVRRPYGGSRRRVYREKAAEAGARAAGGSTNGHQK